MTDRIVIAHNIRSTHNVGSIFRTCEGFGVKRLLLSGYTPYPAVSNDPRLPHIYEKITAQIHKTALGAEAMVPFDYIETLDISSLKSQGYKIIALEQADTSIDIRHFRPTDKMAILLGEEVHGIEPALLKQADSIIEIPMSGQKESFNVSVAAGIALYALTS